MPWLTIIMMLLSFFTSKKSGASNTKALLTAGVVGAASYGVTHYTDWGKANLGDLDGYIAPGVGTPLLGPDGNPVIDGVVPIPTSTTADGIKNPSTSGVFDVLKSWGATGTAAVIGTTAMSTGSFGGISTSTWLAIGAVVAFFVISK